MPEFSVVVRACHTVTATEIRDALAQRFGRLDIPTPIDVRVGRQLKGSSHKGRQGIRLRPLPEDGGCVALAVQPRGNDTNVELHLRAPTISAPKLYELIRETLQPDEVESGTVDDEALTVLLTRGKHSHTVTRDSIRLLHGYLRRHGLTGTIALTHSSDHIKGMQKPRRLVWPKRRSKPTIHLGVQPNGRSSAFAVLFTPPIEQFDAIWESFSAEWQQRDRALTARRQSLPRTKSAPSLPPPPASIEDRILNWLVQGQNYDGLLLALRAQFRAGGWIDYELLEEATATYLSMHGEDRLLANGVLVQLTEDESLDVCPDPGDVRMRIPTEDSAPLSPPGDAPDGPEDGAPSPQQHQQEDALTEILPPPDPTNTLVVHFERLQRIAARTSELSDACVQRRLRLSEIARQQELLRTEAQELEHNLDRDVRVLRDPAVVAALTRLKELETLFGSQEIEAAERVLDHEFASECPSGVSTDDHPTLSGDDPSSTLNAGN